MTWKSLVPVGKKKEEEKQLIINTTQFLKNKKNEDRTHTHTNTLLFVSFDSILFFTSYKIVSNAAATSVTYKKLRVLVPSPCKVNFFPLIN